MQRLLLLLLFQIMTLLIMAAVSVANIFLLAPVVAVPLPDQEPQIANGWGQVVRHRHLYAARAGLHLLIGRDGQIRGSADQTPYSLLEIHPVNPGSIVIRGTATARFLCIESDGKLYSSPVFSGDDCTFREQIQPDGYNVYVSIKHGALLSLGSHRQRLMGRDQDTPSLAQFLPRISTLEQTLHVGNHVSFQPALTLERKDQPLDSVESLGMLSQMIHSPSFHKR